MSALLFNVIYANAMYKNIYLKGIYLGRKNKIKRAYFIKASSTFR